MAAVEGRFVAQLAARISQVSLHTSFEYCPPGSRLATVREPGFPAGGESFRSPCTRPVCPNLCPLPVPCCKTSTPPAPSRTHMAKPGTQAEKNTNKPPKNKGHALSAKLADRRNSLRTNRKTAKRYL